MREPKGTPRCTATAKSGEQCKGHAWRDTEVCLAHSDWETREAVGFTPEAGKAGRPPKPKFIDVQREVVEAEVQKILGVYFDGLDATKETLSGPEADHALRIKAAEALLDRAYGKPTTRNELSGPEGGDVPLWLSIVGLAEAAQEALDSDSGGVDGETRDAT